MMHHIAGLPGVAVFFATLVAAAVPARADMTLRFVNLRPDANTLKAYVSFGGAGNFDATNKANNAALAKGVNYPLTALRKGVRVHEFSSGRIYLSLGARLTTPAPGNGFSPNFANPSLGDFSTRWEKIEITFVAGDGGANLTAQDFFSIPIKLASRGGGRSPATLTWRKGTAPVMAALAKLGHNTIITPSNPTGAIALGPRGIKVPGIAAGKVVRIVSPASVTPKNAAGATVYPSFAPYVNYLRTGNANQPVETMIRGHNGIFAGNLQTYNLIGKIAKVAGMIGGANAQPGDLVLFGTVNSGAGNVVTTILVPADNLNDHAIYGANPSYTMVVGANTNQIAEKVLADYFAALNFGFVGSPRDNPRKKGTSIGDSPSWTWYGNPPTGGLRKPLPIKNAFAFAQPTVKNRYNQYAAYLVRVTDAYGFAYNDRLQSPLASLGNDSVMTLSILPDVR